VIGPQVVSEKFFPLTFYEGMLLRYILKKYILIKALFEKLLLELD
jgi:hypothetical protein